MKLADILDSLAINKYALELLREYPERVVADATPEEIAEENDKLWQLITERAGEVVDGGAELLRAALHQLQLENKQKGLDPFTGVSAEIIKLAGFKITGVEEKEPA